MPSFSRKVQIPGRTAQELYERVAADIERFLSKAAVGSFEVDRDAESKEVRIKGSIFSATLFFQDSEIELKAQLSLLAMPFRSQLDQGIDRWLAKTFNLTNVS
jgi:hypothetical protein